MGVTAGALAGFSGSRRRLAGGRHGARVCLSVARFATSVTPVAQPLRAACVHTVACRPCWRPQGDNHERRTFRIASPHAAPLTRSYARGATDVPLIEQPIGAFFDAIAARQPDHEALVSVHQGRRYSYRELQRETDRLASALLGLGLQPGERVGIWSHNNAEWVLMQLATAKVGLILVNINPAYRTAEVEYALNKVGCKALVTMARFKTSDYLGMLRELAPEWAHGQPGQLESVTLPHLRTVVWIDEAGQGEDQPGLMRFSDLLASGNPDDARLAEVAATLKATDPINIQFTSGTTGFPKGATLTHRNILNNGFFIGEAMKLTPADRLCIPVPLYHCFGMVLGNLACLTHGATIVYPNDGFEPLDACCRRCRTSNAPACTACRRCSSPSWTTRALPSSTCPRCAPASWPARRARPR